MFSFFRVVILSYRSARTVVRGSAHIGITMESNIYLSLHTSCVMQGGGSTVPDEPTSSRRCFLTLCPFSLRLSTHLPWKRIRVDGWEADNGSRFFDSICLNDSAQHLFCPLLLLFTSKTLNADCRLLVLRHFWCAYYFWYTNFHPGTFLVVHTSKYCIGFLHRVIGISFLGLFDLLCSLQIKPGSDLCVFPLLPSKHAVESSTYLILSHSPPFSPSSILRSSASSVYVDFSTLRSWSFSSSFCIFSLRWFYCFTVVVVLPSRLVVSFACSFDVCSFLPMSRWMERLT